MHRRLSKYGVAADLESEDLRVHWLNQVWSSPIFQKLRVRHTLATCLHRDRAAPGFNRPGDIRTALFDREFPDTVIEQAGVRF